VTRSERIAAHVAARIINNTKKKWATLHADALEEIMSTATSSNGLSTSSSSPVRVQIGRDANVETLGVKPVAPNADRNAMAEQYQPSPITVNQVDHNALEGSNKGEHRSGNVDRVPAPPQPSPRQPMSQYPLSGRQSAAPAPELSDTEGSEGERA